MNCALSFISHFILLPYILYLNSQICLSWNKCIILEGKTWSCHLKFKKICFLPSHLVQETSTGDFLILHHRPLLPFLRIEIKILRILLFWLGYFLSKMSLWNVQELCVVGWYVNNWLLDWMYSFKSNNNFHNILALFWNQK